MGFSRDLRWQGVVCADGGVQGGFMSLCGTLSRNSNPHLITSIETISASVLTQTPERRHRRGRLAPLCPYGKQPIYGYKWKQRFAVLIISMPFAAPLRFFILWMNEWMNEWFSIYVHNLRHGGGRRRFHHASSIRNSYINLIISSGYPNCRWASLSPFPDVKIK